MIYTNEYTTTLKEISFDRQNNEYMTESELEVINFDCVKEMFSKNLDNQTDRTLCSNDGLFCIDNLEYMIEFKNGRIKNDTIHKLFWKNFDSILIYLHYKSDSIEKIKDSLNYILVYNEDKNYNHKGTDTEISSSNSRTEIGNTLAKKSGDTFIKFGLGYFKNYIFKNVYTVTKAEFEERFVGNWTREKL